MELYMQNREHGRMILESVEHGPLIWPMVEENGVIRTKKYAELSGSEKIQVDCDIKATNIILQGLHADIYSLLNHPITEDLDTYDFDCDDLSNVQAVLMANISNYGSDVISEEKTNKEQNKESITDELERYKESVKTFEQLFNIDLSSREKMIDSQMDDMIKEKLALKERVDLLEQNFLNKSQKRNVYWNHSIVEVPSELPKKRTPPNALKRGEWGFEHTKAVFNNEIIPFIKSLKNIFNVFDKDLLSEIKEVKTDFDQMEAAVQHSSVDKQVKCSTSASGSNPSGNTKNNRISQPSSSNKINKVEDQPRSVKTRKNNKNRVKKVKCDDHVMQSSSNLMNFVSKFLGTVRFENEQIARIIGYADYQVGNVVILKKNICFICDLEGADLISESRDTNLYTISLDDMLKSSLICLLSKASKTKSWLWNRRLSHLNFGTLNKLAKDAINTACNTQNSSLIRHPYNKTPYELMQHKKPNLSFLHVFALLCYPINDHEDLGKFDAKADIGIFVGYAPAKKVFRIYNKRTRIISKTIHVTFDELTTMASKQFSSGPGLHVMTPATPSTRPVSNPGSQQLCITSNRDDWDHFFQPMFDEYFNPLTIAISSVQEADAPRAKVLADAPVSISISQDAPSIGIPSSHAQEQFPIIS
nr:hypothetical protein [Tanacetum cinerariifolium]